MTRSEQLREVLKAEFTDRAMVVEAPPSDAGFQFEEWGVWRLVVCPEQVAMMAEALDDRRFSLFITGFIGLVRNVLHVIDDDVEQALFDAQRLTAAAMPAAYEVLDSVFSIE